MNQTNTHTRRVLILKQQQSTALSDGKLLTSRCRFIIFKPHGSLRASLLFGGYACAFLLVALLCALFRSLARSFVQLARLFSLAACLRALSCSSLLRSLAWLVCILSRCSKTETGGLHACESPSCVKINPTGHGYWNVIWISVIN